MSATGQVVRELIAGHGVEIVDRGPNVKRGHFNIKCPFCGASDPSHHMGVNEDNGYWGCWRNAEHRGKSPVRLLVMVLGLPVYRVRELLGLRSSPDLELFSSLRDRLTRKVDEVQADDKGPQRLKFPKAFLPLERGRFGSGRFFRYLDDRGFAGPNADRLSDLYDLRYSLSGDFRNRVIIPYYFERQLVTWTARAIGPDTLRYRDLEQDSSVIYKNDLLFNYDSASKGGAALVVLEGPVDVLKGDYVGRLHGVRCVGLSTNTMTEMQLALLAELSDAFDRTFIALDTPTVFNRLDSYKMVSQLRGVLDVEALDTSALGKDLGGAPIRSISNLFKEVAHAAVQ